MVNPVEWWDSHWIEDRILRKLREGNGATSAGGQEEQAAAPAPVSRKVPSKRRHK